MCIDIVHLCKLLFSFVLATKNSCHVLNFSKTYLFFLEILQRQFMHFDRHKFDYIIVLHRSLCTCWRCGTLQPGQYMLYEFWPPVFAIE